MIDGATPTPEQELRAAAAKLRGLATDATPGPWWDERTKTAWGQAPEIEVASSRGTIAELPESENGQSNALYIAVMHPGVGLALADWLDAEADYYAPSPTHPTHLVHALAVARAINGDPS
ncbi:hypothetical protein ACFWDI_28165 [Streptomyces sp. NPDC060064]|uniref:hypothetical protein n=1 Tax=Streptomyces sp. NPDC060064 TaxID=3347049 RepID=UPI0036B8F114